MNNLQRYVNYVTPVIEAITKHHNEFCSLEYFSVRPEDLHAADGVLGFESKAVRESPHLRLHTGGGRVS